MDGKLCGTTGAPDGIGRVTARALDRHTGTVQDFLKSFSIN